MTTIILLSILVTGTVIGVGLEYNQRKRHKENISMLEKISWNTFNITRNTIHLKHNRKQGSKK